MFDGGLRARGRGRGFPFGLILGDGGRRGRKGGEGRRRMVCGRGGIYASPGVAGSWIEGKVWDCMGDQKV